MSWVWLNKTEQVHEIGIVCVSNLLLIWFLNHFHYYQVFAVIKYKWNIELILFFWFWFSIQSVSSQHIELMLYFGLIGWELRHSKRRSLNAQLMGSEGTGIFKLYFAKNPKINYIFTTKKINLLQKKSNVLLRITNKLEMLQRSSNIFWELQINPWNFIKITRN